MVLWSAPMCCLVGRNETDPALDAGPRTAMMSREPCRRWRVQACMPNQSANDDGIIIRADATACIVIPFITASLLSAMFQISGPHPARTMNQHRSRPHTTEGGVHIPDIISAGRTQAPDDGSADAHVTSRSAGNRTQGKLPIHTNRGVADSRSRPDSHQYRRSAPPVLMDGPDHRGGHDHRHDGDREQHLIRADNEQRQRAQQRADNDADL